MKIGNVVILILGIVLTLGSLKGFVSSVIGLLASGFSNAYQWGIFIGSTILPVTGIFLIVLVLKKNKEIKNDDLIDTE